MHLHRVDPADPTAVAELVRVQEAARLVDSPWEPPVTPHRLAMSLMHGWDGEPGESYLAHDGGPGDQVVGALGVSTSDYDNLQLADLGVLVAPEHRGRGLGAELLRAATDRATDLDRPLLLTSTWESPGTSTFAQRHGFRRVSAAINRRMTLADLSADRLQDLYDGAAAHATDYELVRLRDRTPTELHAELALLTAAINDAPIDDMEYEDEVFSPERIAAYEQAQVARGHRLLRVLARHRGTGELAGHTVVAVEAGTPAIGHQHDTAVVRRHRGHRLGLLLKAEMVRWLAQDEPEVAAVDTWNAESNDPMISVNELLGYRVLGRGLQWQRRVGETAPGGEAGPG